MLFYIFGLYHSVEIREDRFTNFQAECKISHSLPGGDGCLVDLGSMEQVDFSVEAGMEKGFQPYE